MSFEKVASRSASSRVGKGRMSVWPLVVVGGEMTGARTPRALFRGRNVECDTSGDRRQATSDKRQTTAHSRSLSRSLTRSLNSRKLPLPVDQSQTAMKKIGDRHKGDLELLAGRWCGWWRVQETRAFAAVELWIETGVRGWRRREVKMCRGLGIDARSCR
jgi:hypothetical protein